MGKFFAFFITLLAAAMIFGPILAFAQEVATAPVTTIRIGDLLAPWLEMLVGAAAVLITSLVGWIATLIKTRTGITIEQSHREALQTALTNAVGLALNKVAAAVGEKTLDVRKQAIRDAILYVNKAAPDAIRHFELTPEAIAEKINAKMGVIMPPDVSDPSKNG